MAAQSVGTQPHSTKWLPVGGCSTTQHKMAAQPVGAQPYDTKWLPSLWELNQVTQNDCPFGGCSTTQHKMAAQVVRAQPHDTKWLPSWWALSHTTQNGCLACRDCADWSPGTHLPLPIVLRIFFPSSQATCTPFTVSWAVWHRGLWAAS